jgi:hypothetical protein
LAHGLGPRPLNQPTGISFFLPVGEFGFVAVGLDLGDLFLHHRLGLLHRLVVDRRADLAQVKVEQHAPLQAAHLLVQFLRAAPLQRAQQAFFGFPVQFDRDRPSGKIWKAQHNRPHAGSAAARWRHKQKTAPTFRRTRFWYCSPAK